MMKRLVAALALALLSVPAVPASAQTYRDSFGTIVPAYVPLGKPVGPASIATSQASISTSAALIVAARTGIPGVGRVSVTLYNSGSTAVYFGSSAVTAANGQVLIAGASVTLDTAAAIYGITASGTGVIGIVESY